MTYHYHAEPYALTYDDDALIGVMRDGYFVYGRRDADGSTPGTLAAQIAGGTGDDNTLYIYGGHTGTAPSSADSNAFHYHLTEWKGCFDETVPSMTNPGPPRRAATTGRPSTAPARSTSPRPRRATACGSTLVPHRPRQRRRVRPVPASAGRATRRRRRRGGRALLLRDARGVYGLHGQVTSPAPSIIPRESGGRRRLRGGPGPEPRQSTCSINLSGLNRSQTSASRKLGRASTAFA